MKVPLLAHLPPVCSPISESDWAPVNRRYANQGELRRLLGMTVRCRSAPYAPPPYCHAKVAHILRLLEQGVVVALA